ncbi:hypothetical protein D9615_003259 [Tricholomella constricta]|uniref:RING-type domain-containing protein n=1 Tax=Tricholomella constricta TaxID=117010 RepID=A0A8H5M8E6_9AGAR|nr:hypothetical protein D9615_003259 [Tricholomella constricta]
MESTRQATPSSSGSVVLSAPSMNPKKRGPSELDGDTDRARSMSIKKLKKDDGVAAATKDKKKRRKRKRKAPVVATAAEPESRPRSKSRSVTVGTQSSAQESVTPNEPAPKSEDLSTIDDADDAMPIIPYADKGKGKAKEESPQPSSPDSPKTQIARLKQELATQSLLLGRHQSQLIQVHQALTCQICLDLLHKPFALAPCGHIVCHGCLVRWFTAPENPVLHPLEEPIRAPGVPEPSHVLKKKKCPICRAQVIERPVEVWGIKSMVAGIARSGLIELPAPLPDLSSASEASTSAGADPWRNIFRRHTHNRFSDIFAPRLPRYVNDPTVAGGVRGGGLEELGMYDAEDGGIYRCIDCMHEIWDGVCSRCHREYPGHRRGGDEDDEDEDEGEEGAFGMGFGWRRRSRTLHDLLNIVAHGPDPFAAGDDSGSESDDIGAFGVGDEDEDEDEDEEHDGELDHLSHFQMAPPPWLPHGAARSARVPPLPPLPPLPPRRVVELPDDEDLEADIARIEEEQWAAGFGGNEEEQWAPDEEEWDRDDEEEEEEDEYDSSFIDDGDGAQLSARDIVEGIRRRVSPGIMPEAPIVSDDEHNAHDDDDDDSDNFAVKRVARRMGRETRHTRRPAVVAHDSEDEDREEARSSSPEIQMLRRRIRSRVDVSSDNEQSSSRRRRSDEGNAGSALELVQGLSSEDSDHEHLSDHEVGDLRSYEDDGSRAGPSSRLLRMMEEDDGLEDEDEDEEDADDDDEW